MQEMDRNLADAMAVVRNIVQNPRICPGGGAIEMALASALTEKAKAVAGVRQWPYRAVARALEVIPRTLVQNCGGSTVRQLTALRAKHASSPEAWTWGIDGTTGELADMRSLKIWDPLEVKLQTFKTAVEVGPSQFCPQRGARGEGCQTAVLLLRIDDIVSGTKKAGGGETPTGPPPGAEGQE